MAFPKAQLHDDRARPCRLCKKSILRGHAELAVEWGDWSDPSGPVGFYAHVTCLARIVNEAPESDTLPTNPQDRAAAIKQRMLDEIEADRARYLAVTGGPVSEAAA